MHSFARLLSPAAALIGLSLCPPVLYADTQPTATPPPPIFVEADRFEVDLTTEKAVWRGNVEATQGNYTFRAASLVVHMEQIQGGSAGATDDPAHGKRGKPVFELSAEAVSYDLDEGQIVGRGNSELRRGVELIRADQITYRVDEGLAVAQPAANGRVQVQFLSDPAQPLFPSAINLGAPSGGD